MEENIKFVVMLDGGKCFTTTKKKLNTATNMAKARKDTIAWKSLVAAIAAIPDKDLAKAQIFAVEVKEHE